jgi:hypothetical protein
MCGEVYGIAKSMASILVREFCIAIRKRLKPLMIHKLIKNKIKEITTSFERLYEIPYILGAINGSHVPIIAPKVNPKSYYRWKGFYYTLIQGVVDPKCSFCDYDYGWASSIHD